MQAWWVAEAVAVAVEVEYDGAVEEPVEHRCGSLGVGGEGAGGWVPAVWWT